MAWRPKSFKNIKEKGLERKLKAFWFLGWLMGLEPTTTGITILDSTS
jgi:hypothetical protein